MATFFEISARLHLFNESGESSAAKFLTNFSLDNVI